MAGSAAIFESGNTNGSAVTCGSTIIPSEPTTMLPCSGNREPTGSRTESGGSSPPSYHHTSTVLSAVYSVPGYVSLTRALVAQLSAVGGGPYAVTAIGEVRLSAR